MSDVQQRIEQLVKDNEVVLFMKGNANFPMCGFSGRAIQLLKASGVDIVGACCGSTDAHVATVREVML